MLRANAMSGEKEDPTIQLLCCSPVRSALRVKRLEWAAPSRTPTISDLQLTAAPWPDARIANSPSGYCAEPSISPTQTTLPKPVIFALNPHRLLKLASIAVRRALQTSRTWSRAMLGGWAQPQRVLRPSHSSHRHSGTAARFDRAPTYRAFGPSCELRLKVATGKADAGSICYTTPDTKRSKL